MNISTRAMNLSARVVPMPWQIKAAHLARKTLDRIGLAPKVPEFEDLPLPDVYTLPLGDIDVSNPFLWRQGLWNSYFKRLRDEQPVHFQKNSPFGPFWSVTRFDDILFVDKHHELFSAEPIITLGDQPAGLAIETFIAMDPPKHDKQRQAVQNVVAPKNLKEMESLIRQRTRDVLDHLPVDEPFDWVSQVSIELTARMLATLLDFPYEQRHKLVYWSDVAAASPETTGGQAERDELFPVAAEVAKAFSGLWHDKASRRQAVKSPDST